MTNLSCSKCGSVNDADAEYCENCGSPLQRECAHCGSPLKPGAKFCNKCGSPASTRPLSSDEAERLAALRQAAPAELKEKLRTASRRDDGQRKPVTILFTDIVGSTTIAEKLDPEEWKEIVSGAHQRVSHAVYGYEGTIAQLLGDGVLAFFGAPVTHEDDPIRAVRAALDIQVAMLEYGRELQGYVDSFQMRIGINTGLVVVANVGSDLHMEYLAIGDAVNLAARLQSAAQPGRVLISENTRRLVQAAFELQPLGEIAVKGKNEPVAVYEVLKSKGATHIKRGFAELRSPLVGREAELSTLKGAFKQLSAGLGQIVWVTGEAGIGKSRLVEEACSQAGVERGALPAAGCQNLYWLEGRALSYGQKLSFWTIRQLLQKDLRLSDGDPEPRIRSTLRRRLQNLFGEDANAVLPYLENLFGVRMEDDLARHVNILDGETLKHQTLLSITRYFSRLAEEQPTVLVFDDLHWADPSSLEALERLLALTDRVPIMLLLLTRLEREHPSWKLKLKAESEFAHRYTDIVLKPLSGDEQNRLVDNLLEIADLPLSVRQRIQERAEGNPLFLEEIIRSLIEQGAIVQDGEIWRTTGEIQSVVIPDTLRGVLLARIDRLQDDVRRTLQLAAVIGKSFLFRLLEVIGEAEELLESHLAQLQRVDLVREKTRLPELEYIFKHSLTQEAAYHSLLVEQRREFHRKVGQALEELFAERREEFVGLLAHHFDTAGDKEKAISYLIRAGDRSRLTDEYQEAIGYYQRALHLAAEMGDDERTAQVLFKLGLGYHANFQFEAAHRSYEKAFALKHKSKVPVPEYSIHERRNLRILVHSTFDDIYDPGIATFIGEGEVISNLFSGLAQVDSELNVVPDVARSWQVLEGGRRYLFHLRDDVCWTDGTAVSAHDFEWAWKRNLHPSLNSIAAQYLYDVDGARDYHQGRCLDPDSVGVRALDALTLEVRLVKPVAYFPYIVTLLVAFPLPRATLERYGEAWWQPENIVSNGAFQLVAFDKARGGIMERYPAYHGEFPGNIQTLEWLSSTNAMDRLRFYQDNQADIVLLTQQETPADIPPGEKHTHHELAVHYAILNPTIPPFNDLRLRRALGFGLDHSRSQKHPGAALIQGGIIPPGMPGHTPDIGWRYDLDAALRLLAEAGFPNGQGLPEIQALAFESPLEEELEAIDQWRTRLGMRLDLHTSLRVLEQNKGKNLVCSGWLADYPDPDNFMRSSCYFTLKKMGWQDNEYEALIESAASTPDRSKRLALYRQADRYLVIEQALVLPLAYAVTRYMALVKPWVKNYRVTPLGRELFKEIVIQPVA